jgi:hypothetical protein
MRAGQELLKGETLANMETYQERMTATHEKIEPKIIESRKDGSQDERQ